MNLKVETPDIRLDKYISDNTDYSRELVNKMLEAGYILVNNTINKSSYKVCLNDEIYIKDGFIHETKLEAKEMPLDIVYEDEYLMVINKPSGLVVHPGNGNKDNTLVNGLLYHNKELAESSSEERPGIVHRLDKDTSGLMLVCKDNKALEILADDFKNKRVHREYIALLDGVFPQMEATIDAPIGKDPNNFLKMKVMPTGKKAITHLKVIKRYKNYTLVSLVLETGRTHQIRVHLSYIGYPLYNDPLYNKKASTDFGQYLHSRYIKFIHPITKETLEFKADLPIEFQSFLDTLNESN